MALFVFFAFDKHKRYSRTSHCALGQDTNIAYSSSRYAKRDFERNFAFLAGNLKMKS